ncbi:unnamed protein product [Mytilus coruscus]|uniref:Sulfotransferase domain-containing protein n=1 Tax=Mytilus coruscus TaxID=42192 RepID=A0A6J8BNE7_MYTCO|nr:unnamed protein product [Mytilus coruscus]
MIQIGLTPVNWWRNITKCILSLRHRSQISADPNQQLSIYPLIEYNGWKFFPLPFLRKDVEKAMESIKTFNSRKNDVLFCTGLKTGTHWVHEILSMLLNHTTEFNTLFDTLQLQLENPLDYNFAETISELRLIHTHFPIECLPTKHLEMGAKMSMSTGIQKIEQFHCIIFSQEK